MVFVRFLIIGLDGKIDEAVGSDSFLRLDARKSLQNQIIDARERLNALRKSVHPEYIGFNVCRGYILRNDVIYRFIGG